MVEQYIKNLAKNYHFIGPVPIDFGHKLSAGNCVIDELCKINMNTILKKGKRKKKYLGINDLIYSKLVPVITALLLLVRICN